MAPETKKIRKKLKSSTE